MSIRGNGNEAPAPFIANLFSDFGGSGSYAALADKGTKTLAIRIRLSVIESIFFIDQ